MTTLLRQTLGRCFRKRSPPSDCEDALAQRRLLRCLTAFDLTAIGVGSTLGAGIYIVVGQVAKETAGPGVAVSFLIAALVSMLAGLCYAEFGASVPGAGSSYLYAYVTVGELPAFLTGWNVTLMYAITAASVAATLSNYTDSLIGGRISEWQNRRLPIGQSDVLTPSVQLLAGLLTLVMTVLLSGSVSVVARLNSAFTAVNVTVIAYVVIVGLFRADFANWSLDAADVPEGAGVGGFAPFGVSGVVAGAGACFFAFVGFDTIATAGDEAEKPQRDIPLSTVLCLLVCCLAYTSVSVALTLLRPYHSLSASAPLMTVFFDVGWPVAAYVVAGGALCSLVASMFGCIFPLPRILFAMSRDGLLPDWLGYASARFQSPAAATAVSGCLATILATFVRVNTLIDIASIGTLAAYTMVAACVVFQRFQPAPEVERQPLTLSESGVVDNDDNEEEEEESANVTVETQRRALVLLLLLLAASGTLAWLAMHRLAASVASWVAMLLLGAVAVVSLCLLGRLPQRRPGRRAYRVPAVPYLPAASFFFNLLLLSNFSASSWLIFAVWMALGFAVYVGWGFRHSRAAGGTR